MIRATQSMTLMGLRRTALRILSTRCIAVVQKNERKE
jgi:hypothetical protein